MRKSNSLTIKQGKPNLQTERSTGHNTRLASCGGGAVLNSRSVSQLGFSASRQFCAPEPA